MIIQVTYIAKWEHKVFNWYKWTECKKLINCKTGKEINKTMKGTNAGYYINRTFVSLAEIKNQIQVIKKENLPF